MEQNSERNILTEVIDTKGNRWWIEHNVIMLKLNKDKYNKKIGLIFNDRFIMYRNRNKNLVNECYVFAIEVLKDLRNIGDINYVDIYDDFGMYRLSPEVFEFKDKTAEILGVNYSDCKGEQLEKELSITLKELEYYKLELPEDQNRINLFGRSWFNELRAEFHKPYWNKLGIAVAKRRLEGDVYPDKEDVFKAFKLTPYNKTKVVIIGQDPYYNGTADGLAFSSKDDMRMPPSLEKIYEGIEDDIKFGLYLEGRTNLDHWAEEGVLLLNTIFTVDAGIPASHHGLGWEIFMGRVLEVLRNHPHDLVFMLWGTFAKGLKDRVENGRHLILEAEHPAYAARNGRKWEHNNNFKKCNAFLHAKGYTEINW